MRSRWPKAAPPARTVTEPEPGGQPRSDARWVPDGDHEERVGDEFVALDQPEAGRSNVGVIAVEREVGQANASRTEVRP